MAQGRTLLRRWLPILAAMWLICSTSVLAGGMPKPTQAFFVNDYADILSPQAEAAIASEGKALEEATTAQVVVVTVPNLDGKSLEDYSIGLAREWGIGKKDKDNGVLLFITRDDHKVRIEVGYGLEGAITDGKSGRILDEYLIPSFKQGDYDGGTEGAYRALLAAVYQEYGKPMPEGVGGYAVQDQPVQETRQIPSWMKIVGIIILLMIFRRNPWLLWLLLRNGGRGGGGGGGSSGGGGGFGGGGSSRGW